MNRRGIAIILVLMFALALGAGAVAGKLSARIPKDPAPARARTGTLAEELKLTHEQSEQMQAIWEGVSRKSKGWVNDATAIQKAEDDALIEHILTTDEQKKAFRDLRAESARKLNLLEEERKAAFDKAVEGSKKLMNEDQKQLYDQIIREKTGTAALPNPSGGGASDGWNFANTARACR